MLYVFLLVGSCIVRSCNLITVGSLYFEVPDFVRDVLLFFHLKSPHKFMSLN
jgi:hypothetical protein